MANNAYYVSAGLQISKQTSVTPTANVNTYYITAGLPPVEWDDAAVGVARPKVGRNLAHGSILVGGGLVN